MQTDTEYVVAHTFAEIAEAVRTYGVAPTTRIETGEGLWLIPAGASYGDAELEDVLERRVAPVEIRLTHDGRAMVTDAWCHVSHADTEAHDLGSVYVERWDADGRGFHGYVCSITRRIVQAG